jgi:AcrR family transcriptional regulator
VGSQEGQARVRDRTTKGRQTREAIERSARKLFAERGFHGTTLADITAAAGKSPAVFYRYFDDKEDLLADLAESFLHNVLSEIVVYPPESPDDTQYFTSMVTGYWNIFKQNVGIMVAVGQLGATQPRFAAVHNEFRRFGMGVVRASVLHARGQGYGTDLDTEHISLAIALLFEQFTTVYLRSDAAALGVHTTDEDAIRTLATIWKKTLYGNIVT